MVAGGGGAFVVVRAGESPVHGEGRQRACSARLEGEEVAGEYRRSAARAEGGAGPGTRDPAQAAQVGQAPRWLASRRCSGSGSHTSRSATGTSSTEPPDSYLERTRYALTWSRVCQVPARR